MNIIVKIFAFISEFLFEKPYIKQNNYIWIPVGYDCEDWGWLIVEDV